MPRDECRDCEQRIAGDTPEFDGHCSPCYLAFAGRQAIPTKPPAKARAKGKKE